MAGDYVSETRVDATTRCKFFKRFLKKPVENLKIKSIKFGVFSDRDIHQLSATEITSDRLYNEITTEPNDFGPLDRRLGTTSKRYKEACKTCGNTADKCIGHFGHIDLVLPCFHIGYIKDCIQILRMICKSCSRILLNPSTSNPQDDPNYWRKRMRYNLYIKKKFL